MSERIANKDGTAKMRNLWSRWVFLVLLSVGLSLVIAEIYIGWENGWFAATPDYDNYMSIARRWLADGSYFLSTQTGGPHQWAWGDVLYPPVALWLFVPFSFLPMVAWFAIPFAVIVTGLWKLRPALWAVAIMSFLVCEPNALDEVVSGNTVIWFVAIEFAALSWGTPASLGLFKPSLFPFVLVGIHTRQWWMCVGLLALLSLPFMSLSLTWVQVVMDERGRSGLFYNIEEFAYALIPYIAWLGSTRAKQYAHGPKSLWTRLQLVSRSG
jgi:hypothetical protein